MQRLADKVAAYFVPAVIATAVLAFLAWMLFGPEPRFAYGLVAAVSVLIHCLPCALGLATPMSIMVAVGRGAHAGVLIRSAEALEILAKVDTLVVDKTGTLTEGKPQVTGITVFAGSGFTEDSLLSIAASLESLSEHPLARAVVSAAQEKRLPLVSASEFRATSGGAWRVGRGETSHCGNGKLPARAGNRDPADERTDVQHSSSAATPVYVAVDSRAVGIILLSDNNQSVHARSQFARCGGRDAYCSAYWRSRAVADRVASTLGIEEVEAEVQPQQKAEIVKRLRGQGASLRWLAMHQRCARHLRRRMSA